MAWLRSHQELARNPKTRRLARLLGVSLPQVIGHLHLLWWWAMDFAPDGDLSYFEAEEIAEAAGWEGDAEEFVVALVNARGPSGHGFIEENKVIHEWHEHAGRLIEQRIRNAERMRKARATHVQRTCNARAGAREDKIREDKRETIHDTCIDIPDNGEVIHSLSTFTPPLSTSTSSSESGSETIAGWVATEDSMEKAVEIVRELEGYFGIYPFTNRQLGVQQQKTMERLAAACRILTSEEIIGLVRAEYERKRNETRGVDAPMHLPYYMPIIADAAKAKDQELERAEREREKKKRAGPRAGDTTLSETIEDMLSNKEPTPEERAKHVQRIRELRERLRAAGGGL